MEAAGLDGGDLYVGPAERTDAEKLYAVMSRLGGPRLVGKGVGLPPDLYYDAGRNG